MTSKLTITDERVISVIERLEHYACNLKWTNVRGAQDLLTAADGLRELQERRKAAMDSEPVAWTDEEELRDVNVAGIGYLFGIDREANKFADPRRQIMLYHHAPPAKGLELAGWQFKSVNGDWLGLIDEHGKNQAVREGCEVREVFAMADGVNERDQIRREHAEWSQAIFGNVGPVGPLKHLSKEALEAAAEPDDLSEWADMQFLLWDAQRRAGITDEQITQAMIEKLAVNKLREWPAPKDGEPRLHIKEQPAAVAEREPIAWLNDAYLARGVVDGEGGSEDAGPGYIPVYREAGPQPAPVVTFYRDGIEAAANYLDQQRKAYDSEHGWSDPDTGAFEFGNDAQREYSSTLEELAEGIRGLHPNAGNSPVIPDGYRLQPISEYEAMCATVNSDEWPQRWIPVSEQMPEVGDIVLTAMGGVVNVGETECSAANCRFFTSVISGRELPATHWMPLPAGPQEVR